MLLKTSSKSFPLSLEHIDIEADEFGIETGIIKSSSSKFLSG